MGVEQLMLGALMVLVLLRYRAMIPLMYVLLVMHVLASRGVSSLKPLALAGASGAATPALVIATLSALGLVLSLVGPGYSRGASGR